MRFRSLRINEISNQSLNSSKFTIKNTKINKIDDVYRYLNKCEKNKKYIILFANDGISEIKHLI